MPEYGGLKMNNNIPKAVLFAFALIVGLFVLSSFASADEGNETGTNTTNTSANITENVTGNITDNITGNVSANTTANVTENTTGNVTENITSNTTTNTSVNVTVNTTANITTNITNTTNTSIIDDKDIEMFKLNYGMKVRLLQLEKRLINHILTGSEIIETIKAKNLSTNTSILESKIEGLEDIKTEIDRELAKNPVNVSTEKFVELKARAINLTFEFRRELHSLLMPGQISEIKKDLPKKMERHERALNSLDGKLQGAIHQYNFEKAMQLMKKFGKTQNELENRTRNLNVSPQDLRKVLKDEYDELGQERKRAVLEELKENKREDLKEKARFYGKQIGLEEEEIESVLDDSTMTSEEKESRLRIIAKQKEARNNPIANDAINQNRDISNERKRGR
jgi:hypothetical protein